MNSPPRTLRASHIDGAGSVKNAQRPTQHPATICRWSRFSYRIRRATLACRFAYQTDELGLVRGGIGSGPLPWVGLPPSRKREVREPGRCMRRRSGSLPTRQRRHPRRPRRRFAKKVRSVRGGGGERALVSFSVRWRRRAVLHGAGGLVGGVPGGEARTGAVGSKP